LERERAKNSPLEDHGALQRKPEFTRGIKKRDSLKECRAKKKKCESTETRDQEKKIHHGKQRCKKWTRRGEGTHGGGGGSKIEEKNERIL